MLLHYMPHENNTGKLRGLSRGRRHWIHATNQTLFNSLLHANKTLGQSQRRVSLSTPKKTKNCSLWLIGRSKAKRERAKFGSTRRLYPFNLRKQTFLYTFAPTNYYMRTKRVFQLPSYEDDVEVTRFCYGKPPAISRSPQLKMASLPKSNVEPKVYWAQISCAR